MKTISIDIYTIDEIKEHGAELYGQIIEDHWTINVDFEWWEFIYEDAKSIGLEITGFDVDRRDIRMEYIYDASYTKNEILKNHGRLCDTYRTVKEFDLRKDCGDDMLMYLGEEYLSILRQEYEWLTSEAQIHETLQANEYRFDLQGKMH